MEVWIFGGSDLGMWIFVVVEIFGLDRMFLFNGMDLDVFEFWCFVLLVCVVGDVCVS